MQNSVSSQLFSQSFAHSFFAKEKKFVEKGTWYWGVTARNKSFLWGQVSPIFCESKDFFSVKTAVKKWCHSEGTLNFYFLPSFCHAFLFLIWQNWSNHWGVSTALAPFHGTNGACSVSRTGNGASSVSTDLSNKNKPFPNRRKFRGVNFSWFKNWFQTCRFLRLVCLTLWFKISNKPIDWFFNASKIPTRHEIFCW